MKVLGFAYTINSSPSADTMVRLLHQLLSRAGERISADRSKEGPCVSTKNVRGDIIQAFSF